MEKSLLRKAIREEIRSAQSRDPASFHVASQIVCRKLIEWMMNNSKLGDLPERKCAVVHEGVPNSSLSLHPEESRRISPPSLLSTTCSSSSYSSPLLFVGAYWPLSTELSLEPFLNTLWSHGLQKRREKQGEEERGGGGRLSGEKCSKLLNEERTEKGSSVDNNKVDESYQMNGGGPLDFLSLDSKREEEEWKILYPIWWTNVAVVLPVVLTTELHQALLDSMRARQACRGVFMSTVKKPYDAEKEEEKEELPPLSSTFIYDGESAMMMLEVFDREDFENCFTEEGRREGGKGIKCRSIAKEKLLEIFFSNEVEIILGHPHGKDGRICVCRVKTKEKPKEKEDEREEEVGKEEECDSDTSCPGRSFSSSSCTSPLGNSENQWGSDKRSEVKWEFMSPSLLGKKKTEMNTSCSAPPRRIWLSTPWDILFPGCSLQELSQSSLSSSSNGMVEFVLFTPGLGFTRDGARLGKGKGFYDRFIRFYGGNKDQGPKGGRNRVSSLTTTTTTMSSSTTSNTFSSGGLVSSPLKVKLTTVAVGFDFQLLDDGTIPQEAHDEAISAVVTPSFSSLGEW